MTPGNYTVKLTVTDSKGLADPTPAVFTVYVRANNYCVSKATNTTYEYISQIMVSLVSRATGNNGGYSDQTLNPLSLPRGGTYANALTPWAKYSTDVEYWSIWIDSNGDGMFDLNEWAGGANGEGGSSVYPLISPRPDALIGPTRMRVQMKFGTSTAPTNDPTTGLTKSASCEIYTFGEVEDYTVIITQ